MFFEGQCKYNVDLVLGLNCGRGFLASVLSLLMTMGGRGGGGGGGGGAVMAISSPSTGRVSTAPSVVCHSHLVSRGEARTT